MQKLIVVGAGGHARSVVDIALQNDEFELVGCIDPGNGDVLGIPVIGNDSDLPALRKKGIQNIFIAVGSNSRRNALFKEALRIGFEPVNIISRHSVISPRVRLGIGICVMAGAVVNVNVVIGDNSIINTRCSIDHDCKIGMSSHIAPGVTVSGTVVIGEGVHIGTGTSVIDGITIGDWSYIGGGAVVVKNLPSGIISYGIPARVVREINQNKV